MGAETCPALRDRVRLHGDRGGGDPGDPLRLADPESRGGRRVLFFVGQVAGFLVDKIKKRSPLGFASTVLGGIAIFLWGAGAGLDNVIDANGRFLMWGENAPLLIQAIYFIWVVQVVVEMRSLPKLTEASAHVVSVIIAVISGQFFFARLLTASQVIMFDGVIRYTDRAFVGKDFLTVDEGRLTCFRASFHRVVSPALFCLLAVLVALSSWQSLQRLGLL